jgi:arsenate reductase
MEPITIYHNPRCGKSRATLALLQEKGMAPTVIEYLKTPPSAKDLAGICHKLGIKPGELVRQGEDIFKSEYAGKTLTDVEWLEAMARHPILIERPIVIRGAQAIVGRPPENALRLLK